MTPHADLLLQLQRHQALLEVLEVLTRASHSASDVVGAVHQHAGRLVDANATVLALRQPDGWLCDLFHLNERATLHVAHNERGLSEQVFVHGPLRVPDVDDYLARHDLTVRNLRDHAPQLVRAYLGVPLHAEGERVGVLSLQSYTLDAFSDLDLHFLELLAKHVSLALENARLRERLERAALTDPLTGLNNRRAFERDAARAAGRAAQLSMPLTLVMLDAQGFKHVNDRYGHAAGDDVLRVLGRLLHTHMRAGDAAFRLGGDEFAALLWCDEAEARDAASRLSALLAAHAWTAQVPEIRVNAGVAALRERDDLDTWQRRADARMYAAKAARRLLSPAEDEHADEHAVDGPSV